MATLAAGALAADLAAIEPPAFLARCFSTVTPAKQ
jgi:hypothetical protein